MPAWKLSLTYSPSANSRVCCAVPNRPSSVGCGPGSFRSRRCAVSTNECASRKPPSSATSTPAAGGEHRVRSSMTVHHVSATARCSKLSPTRDPRRRPSSPSGWRVPDSHVGTTLSNLEAPKILSPSGSRSRTYHRLRPENSRPQRWAIRGFRGDAEAARFGVPIIPPLVRPEDSTAAVHRQVPIVPVRVRVDAEADARLSQGRPRPLHVRADRRHAHRSASPLCASPTRMLRRRHPDVPGRQ